ncbi:CLL_collapsed_G0029140.mRNA.1.CDS.1 [Saccharomyces cerevisiae]|nr:CLL_collapsed_G0029140.mRNA.1.CDS.1 [Saccharomyces cerevisiae]
MSSDVDLRATLAHNVVLTGGTSSIPGLSDRLMTELNKILPSLKFRILTTGHTIERQYQSWLVIFPDLDISPTVGWEKGIRRGGRRKIA